MSDLTEISGHHGQHGDKEKSERGRKCGSQPGAPSVLPGNPDQIVIVVGAC
jgi:hypothetical protein